MSGSGFLRRQLLRWVPVAGSALNGLLLCAVLPIVARYLPAAELVMPTGFTWFLFIAVLILVHPLALLFRQRFPLTVLWIVTVTGLACMVPVSGQVDPSPFPCMFAAYAVARNRSSAQWMAHVVAAALAVFLVHGVLRLEHFGTASFLIGAGQGVIVLGIPVLIAQISASREHELTLLRERAESAERDREHHALEAARRERMIMARELHDIAGHHLSGIIVSAQAADTLLRSDPRSAGEYLASITREARATLENLRETVALLRTDEPGEHTPVATIEQLPRLVEEASVAAAPIQLRVRGEPVALGPLASTAAYRMVQESLANAARHAAGANRAVELHYGSAELRITVRNDRGSSTGTPRKGNSYGLLGMAERAELIGGTLTTGAVQEGGWMNTLTIPYGDAGRRAAPDERARRSRGQA